MLEHLKKNFPNLSVSKIFKNVHTDLKKAPEKVFPEARVIVYDLNYAEVSVCNLNYAKVMPKQPTIKQFLRKFLNIFKTKASFYCKT